MVERNLLLEIHVANLPVQWQRARGSRTRFTQQDLRAWKEFIKAQAKEEMAATGTADDFPYGGPVQLNVVILLPDEKHLNICADGDNIYKGIADALSKVAYPDDKPLYVRGGSFAIDIAPSNETVGTHVYLVKKPV